MGLGDRTGRPVARSLDHRITRADAYLVEAIAPVPLWLSSLVLLLDNPVLNTLLPLSALVSCAVLVYQGALTLCHIADRLEAATITHTAFGAGLILWMFFLLLAIGG